MKLKVVPTTTRRTTTSSVPWSGLRCRYKAKVREKEASFSTIVGIGGRGVGNWKGDQPNFGEGGSGFWNPRGGTNFTCLRRKRGGIKGKIKKMFSRAAKSGQIFAVLHHKIVIFSAAFGGHPVGGVSGPKTQFSIQYF